jgi:hypothetical protein
MFQAIITNHSNASNIVLQYSGLRPQQNAPHFTQDILFHQLSKPQADFLLSNTFNGMATLEEP